MHEVKHTALDADVQASMDRVLRHCASNNLALAARAAKAVALLKLIQERVPHGRPAGRDLRHDLPTPATTARRCKGPSRSCVALTCSATREARLQATVVDGEESERERLIWSSRPSSPVS
ncbi:MAG: hypothetical protein IPH44_33640 [Myxococcales bacterium]|nr:hypothetical protein [Myxococcales bacterium]